MVDRDLAESTTKEHLYNIEQFLEEYESNWRKARKQDIREWLKDYDNKWTRANKIKSARVFFDSFLNMNIANFKIPQPQPNTNRSKIKDKEELQEFYKHIKNPKYEAVFLILASSGLRVGELAELEMDDIDFEKRMIIPNHNSKTKKSFITFYNSEAEKKLEQYLPERKDDDERVFQALDRTIQRSFQRCSKRAGIKITAQDSRKWFCKEMRNLDVSPEHIDCYCGRVPKSVRGKHYTDFSPERLKEVYEKADLKVLE